MSKRIYVFGWNHSLDLESKKIQHLEQIKIEEENLENTYYLNKMVYNKNKNTAIEFYEVVVLFNPRGHFVYYIADSAENIKNDLIRRYELNKEIK